VLEEQALNTRLHDRTSFRCGVPELDDYLHRFAAQQSARGVSAVYVLVDSEQPSRILGFYTLSAAQVGVLQMRDSDQKKLPRYPVPCFRMGRLACSVTHRGQGLGKLLLGCAVERCLQARKQVAAFAMLVDAKNDSAKAFYLHYGFMPCADSPLKLYLPLGSTAL
jgi:predicted GNAT family N-acyltransferase